LRLSLVLAVGLALFAGPALADCFAEDLAAIEATATAGKWRKLQSLGHRLDRRLIFKAEQYQASSALLAYVVIDMCSDLPYPEGVTSTGCAHDF